MKESTEILDYIIHWRSKSASGFIGELFHILRNTSGGSMRVPVGIIIGFIEPGDEYFPDHWSIVITIREEIRYDLKKGKTTVFIKSAYANKFKYHGKSF